MTARDDVLKFIESGGEGTAMEIGAELGLRSETVYQVMLRLVDERLAEQVAKRTVVSEGPRPRTRIAHVYGAPRQPQLGPNPTIVERAIASQPPLFWAWNGTV
jgi:predicted ArsR family transcriptional regulator